jgi:hypothetical protein
MCTTLIRVTLVVMALAGVPSAWADQAKSPADPVTKTLPAVASDTAKANAFGVQGTAMRAAHQAARAAAAQEARMVATRGQPAGAVRPSASAQAHASGMGLTNGFTRATAGAANGAANGQAATTHRRP